MSSNAKRCVRDAEMRVERVKYKFVNDYVKHLHKDTYMKAQDLYNKIRKLYAKSVKDITKTVEFMEVTNQHEKIPRHYAKKRKAEVEMALRIPLMSLPLSVSSTAVSSPTHVSSVPLPPSVSSTPVSSPTHVSSVPLPPSVSSTAVSSPTHVSSSTAVSLPQNESSVPLLLSDNTFDLLMQELQKDPDLVQILNGFPDDFPEKDPDLVQILNGFPDDFPEDDQSLCDDVWYETMADSMTPLERELSLY